MTVLTIHRP